MTTPNTLADIRKKVRRITGRINENQITNDEIDEYINTFYLYDLPEHLRLQCFKVNYQFVTNANQAVYDFSTDFYVTNSPPVFCDGYQISSNQSRENFFRTNPFTNMIVDVGSGNGGPGPYAFNLLNKPILHGWKRNPPGAYFLPSAAPPATLTVPVREISWAFSLTALDSNGRSLVLVDDGGANATGHANVGNLYEITDVIPTNPSRGTINYLTGVCTATFSANVPTTSKIKCHFYPYVASRPQYVNFFQNQFFIYPIPDQAYTISFEAFKYPTAFLKVASPEVSPATISQTPEMKDLWQLLAYGAADKIFADSGDFENLGKYRQLLEEQLRLIQRRTLVQYSAERVSTIYSDQTNFPQYPFNNLLTGF